MQKASLYSHIASKADLLWEVAREGSAAFHGFNMFGHTLARATLVATYEAR